MAVAKNTKTKGSVRGLFFKEDDTWYGVALELNIIVNGKSKERVFLELQRAIKGYVTAVRKAKYDDTLLNQKPVSKYERMWNTVIERKRRQPIASPFFFAGVFPLEQYAAR